MKVKSVRHPKMFVIMSKKQEVRARRENMSREEQECQTEKVRVGCRVRINAER
jgi:hypothetical protein